MPKKMKQSFNQDISKAICDEQVAFSFLDQKFNKSLDKEKYNTFQFVGIDEVGRGPCAGPVVACSAGGNFYFANKKTVKEAISNITSFLRNLGVTDSKKLTAKKRQKILEKLNINWKELRPHQVYKVVLSLDIDCTCELKFCLGEISPEEIDEINILQASLKSMLISYQSLWQDFFLYNSSYPQLALGLVDGNRVFELKTLEGSSHIELCPIIKGDSRSALIGLASIIAKEFRDHYMTKMAEKYPQYGFEKHAGYPTLFHRNALTQYGPCPIHRLSYAGVIQDVSK